MRFRVLLDGKPPGADHGMDIDAEGNGVVREQRLYQLIRQKGAVGEHEFTIEFLDGHVESRTPVDLPSIAPFSQSVWDASKGKFALGFLAGNSVPYTGE